MIYKHISDTELVHYDYVTHASTMIRKTKQEQALFSANQ